jgi:hypothetical protein
VAAVALTVAAVALKMPAADIVIDIVDIWEKKFKNIKKSLKKESFTKFN